MVWHGYKGKQKKTKSAKSTQAKTSNITEIYFGLYGELKPKKKKTRGK